MKALMIQKLFSNATVNKKKRVYWCSIITGYMEQDSHGQYLSEICYCHWENNNRKMGIVSHILVRFYPVSKLPMKASFFKHHVKL